MLHKISFGNSFIKLFKLASNLPWCTVAYAEIFHGGIFIQWHMVVICIWCALFLTSQLDVIFMFSNNVLAKLVYSICIIFDKHSPYFMCDWTDYKLSALQARISKENTTNATTQQFITEKISGCALKQGSKHTHHCVKAIFNCKMRLRWCLFEYEQSSIETVRLDWLAHTQVARSNLSKLHKNWKCA